MLPELAVPRPLHATRLKNALKLLLAIKMPSLCAPRSKRSVQRLNLAPKLQRVNAVRRLKPLLEKKKKNALKLMLVNAIKPEKSVQRRNVLKLNNALKLRSVAKLRLNKLYCQ